MRTEMLSTAEEQRRGRKSEGLEITNFVSFLLCCLGSVAENQCELCFPMLRVQVGSCVCASSQCQQVYVPGRELRLWRTGSLMGPVRVHGGMAQASVNVPFQRRFPVARYILAVKAPPI